MKLIHLQADDAVPNSFNANSVSAENMTRLRESLRRRGWIKPMIVRPTSSGYEILGGQHRFQAACDIGMLPAPAIVLDVDDRQAREIALLDNTRYGEDDAGALQDILREIGGPDELNSFLPLIDAQLATLGQDAGEINLDTLGLDDEQAGHGDAHEKRAARTHQVMRFKIAVEDADDIADLIRRTQDEQGFTDSDKLTNAGDALVWLLNQQED